MCFTLFIDYILTIFCFEAKHFFGCIAIIELNGATGPNYPRAKYYQPFYGRFLYPVDR